MVSETLVLLVLLGCGAVMADRRAPGWLVAIVVALQGGWLHRLYTAAHEAVHGKLVRGRPWLNDLIGQLLLLPLLTPLRIYRHIHRFHHAYNRHDERTSALELFRVRHPERPTTRFAATVVWWMAVFGGGFLLYSLASVLLFLLLPKGVAQRLSPAFDGWSGRDRARAIGAWSMGVAVHAALAAVLGLRGWMLALGAPMLVFAWLYSLIMYVYHYDTAIGGAPADRVRSLRAGRLFAWWLLNFQEHATHHARPTLPWYALPAHATQAPSERRSIASGVLAQLKGPRLVRR